MDAVTVPLLAGLAVGAVIGLSALYQHYQFRRNGDPPVFTPWHALTYGIGTAFSSALGEVWNPPLWQKLLIYCLIFGLAWAVLRLFLKRRTS